MVKEIKKLKYKSFDEVEEIDTEWLWYPYFPMGKLSFIAGDPGVGKSYISMFLASIVSKGEKIPFLETNAILGNVIVQNGEDGAGDTIKKRLVTLKANTSKIFMIDEDNLDNEEDYFTLKDVDKLEELIKTLNPKLVVFDPITSFIGEVNINDAPAVRGALRPIGKLAEKYNCAIVFVIHRNKGVAGGNQLHRMLGSVDFGGIARSVVSIGLNPNNKNEKLFMHTKYNLSKQGQTLAFKSSEEGITWIGTREYLQDDTIATSYVEKISPREAAKEFIIKYLENGKARYEDILNAAIEKGISKKTLERAREDLKEFELIDKKNESSTVYWFLTSDISPFMDVYKDE